MVNWGFLSAGSIAGNSLAPAVHAADGAVLHSVASSSRSRSRTLRPHKTHASYDALLQDPDVDVVLHTARRTGRLPVEAAWNRRHPRTRGLEAMVRDGAIGDVTSVVARFEGLAPAEGNHRLDPALGGGVLYDVGYYAVSAAFNWCAPCVLWAKQEHRYPGSADCLTGFLLELPGQWTAEIRCSLVGTMEEVLTIIGTAGTLTLSAPAFRAGAAPARLLSDGCHPDREHPAVDPYRLMVEAVDVAVLGQSSPYLVPLEESRLIADTIDAVREHLLHQGETGAC